MDNVDLNNSPDLTMEQITKLLFNNEFMSDVQFRVEDKVIYAHSWELMKRSVVYRQQFLGTLGDNKLISIADTSYVVFYQFMRYIYTDKLDIDNEMIFELFKLAAKYKIVKLETKLLGMPKCIDVAIKFFEYSVVNKYDLYFNSGIENVIILMDSVIESEAFLEIHPNAMEEILKSKSMSMRTTEVELFNTLVRWMNKSCEKMNIPLSQRRSNFDKLLRLIRFPNMTSDEFRLCAAKHPDLFTSQDFSTICSQIILGPQSQCKILQWPSEPRLKYVYPWEARKRLPNHNYNTKFTVSANLVLHGLKYASLNSDFEIIISGKFLSETSEIIKFDFEDSPSNKSYNLINLGDSIKLRPNVAYTIEISPMNEMKQINYRRSNVDVVVTGPANLVTFQQISQQLFEIFFKLPN